MFSENNKISARQTKRLLQLDWIARLVVLLPVCLSGKSMGSVVFCILAGSAVWWLLSGVVLKWMGPEMNPAAEVKSLLGGAAAVVFCFAGLLFFLVQAAVFLNLTAELSSYYLLPEVPVSLICLLPVTAAVILAAESIEVPGRFCEVCAPVLTVLLVLLVFLAAFGMEVHPQEKTMVDLGERLEVGSFEVFACLGGLFLPMLGGHMAERMARHETKRRGLAAALLAGSLCVVVVGSYGKNGMQYVAFPAIRVMSNLRLPGVFLQRWDVLFLALLLVCLTVTVTLSLWHVRMCLELLWGAVDTQKVKRIRRGKYARQADWAWEMRVTLSWCACILLVYFAAAGFLSAWSAISYYRALNLQVLTPLIFFFYIIIAAQKIKRVSFRFSRGLALLLLVAVSIFWLSGCTAHEPEERLFPMALEIRAGEGELVVAYAWDAATAPGNMSENGGSDSETGKYAENVNGITVFRGRSLSEIQKKTSAFSERYMDYSHVKAVLLDESLKQMPELEKSVVEWMAGEPAFASGLIIYEISEEGIALEQVQKQSGGQVGKYLENLYNNNEEYRARSTTLGRLIAEYYV